MEMMENRGCRFWRRNGTKARPDSRRGCRGTVPSGRDQAPVGEANSDSERGELEPLNFNDSLLLFFVEGVLLSPFIRRARKELIGQKMAGQRN